MTHEDEFGLAILPYMYEGLVQDRPNPTEYSGNTIRYSSEAGIILSSKVFLPLIEQLQVVPGVINRSPTGKNQQGPDDYTSLLSYCSSVGVVHLPREILEHGQKNHWVYNNEVPGTLKRTDGKWNLSALFIRFPALICQMHHASGLKPNLFWRLGWVVSIYLGGKNNKDSQDHWILNWHLINSYLQSESRSTIEDAVVEYWKKQYKISWPGGTKELLIKYFDNPNHPLALFWKDFE